MEKCIPTEPVKEKLRDLRKYIPDAEDLVVEFAQYLADQLGTGDLYPFGFAFRYDYDVKSLYHGRHGGGQPINHKLARMLWKNYALILSYFSRIVDVVLPPKFASKTKRIFEKTPRTRKMW